MSADLRIIHGIHVATVRGALDGTRGTGMVNDIRASVERGGRIVLDCAGVDRMDVDGLRQLLALKRWTDKDNGKLVIAALSRDAQQVITGNGCDGMFDLQPSVPAALQSLGVAPEIETQREEVSQPESRYPSQWDDEEDWKVQPQIQPERHEEKNEWAAPQQSYPQNVEQISWISAPEPRAERMEPRETYGTESSVERAWADYAQPVPASRGRTGGDPGAVSVWKKPAFIIGLVLGLVLIAGAAWLLLRQGPMEMTMEPREITVREGESPRVSVEIKLKNGQSADVSNLPEGLVLKDISESEDALERRYTVDGVLRTGAGDNTFRVSIIGQRDGESTPAQELLIKTLRKKQAVAWVPSFVAPTVIQEGTAVPEYCKIADGAATLEATGLPPGLNFVQKTDSPGTWVLQGTPGLSGDYNTISISAKSPTGDPSSYPGQLALHVEPRPSPAVVEAPPPPPPPPSPSSPIPPTSGGTDNGGPKSDPVVVPPFRPDIDDKMREILMVRIDGMAGKFDEFEIRTLRDVVTKLQAARRLGRVESFTTGKSTISPGLEDDVTSMLKDNAYKELLNHPDCYIVVVGYASRTGSKVVNDRLSRDRARALNSIVKRVLGRDADLCGAYGATEIHGDSLSSNQAAEIFAGVLQLNPAEKELADRFRERFNQ